MQATSYTLPATREKPIGFLITIHVLFGIVAYYYDTIVPFYFYSFTVYSVLNIIQNRNRDNYASYAAVYLVSMEMLLRMSRSFAIYEMGKYSLIIVLVAAMLVERNKKPLSSIPILYMALLIPSIFVGKYSSFFQERVFVTFNLSGPLSLCISWLYFSGRSFNKKDFSALCLNLVLPLISTLPWIILSIPKHAFQDLAGTDIQSSRAFSGGFGPNQVSAAMGFAFFILSLALLIRVKVSISRTVDFMLAFMFLGFSLLTFSRGGALTGILSLVGSTYALIRSGRLSKQFSRIFLGLVVFGAAGYFVWQVLNSYTGNSLTDRYESTIKSKKAAEEGGVDVSGRLDILKRDLNVFLKHPFLGDGPGGSSLSTNLASHTEFSRLMSDHGSLGLVAIILLFSGIISKYKGRNPEEKAIMIGFGAICFLTISHEAMRLAIPGLCYGLALIKVNFTDNPLEKT